MQDNTSKEKQMYAQIFLNNKQELFPVPNKIADEDLPLSY